MCENENIKSKNLPSKNPMLILKTRTKHTHSTAQQKAQLTSLLHRTKFLESELKAICDLADERGREVVHLKDSSLPSVENNKGDNEVIQAALQRQTAYLRNLKRANLQLNKELTHISERSTSIVVLQKEKRALEGKLASTWEGDWNLCNDSTQQGQGFKLKATKPALREQEKERVKKGEERVKALTEEQKTHLAQMDALEQELFELQGEMAAGCHVPPNTRIILQLRGNPES
ncbi:hypothetical protein H0H87_005113 [Tephrocybe sp. NHM501043]|nr:hypothetical protein H0H87_005113 [Tephrocybe sp. NHM501043]